MVEFRKRIIIQDSKLLLRISPPEKRALSYKSVGFFKRSVYKAIKNKEFLNGERDFYTEE